MNSTIVSSDRWDWHDAVLLVAVSVATYIYTGYVWPYLLVGLDEGAFVYEGKRILDGDVMYRDFFDLTAPIAQYLLAFWYLLFGTTMETARLYTAAQHAVIVACGYAICRRLGARSSISAVCMLADLVLFYPAFAMASPHWVSTMFAMIAFWYVIRASLLTPCRAITAGVLTALIALTRQPSGVALAAAVGIVLLRDVWIDGVALSFPRAVMRQLGAYGVGLLVVAVSILGGLMLSAGFWSMFEALVLVPLGPYRDDPFVREGRWLLSGLDRSVLWILVTTMSPMLILNVMPFIIPVSATRLLWQWLEGVNASALRPLFVAVSFSIFAIVSMLYQPNHFHFAIVGPMWVVLYAEALERLFRRLEGPARRVLVEPLGVLVLLLLLGLRVGYDLPRAWGKVQGADHSTFGRVDFRSAGEASDVAAVRTVLHDAGVKEIFVYPCAAALYLMTDTDNPTRFQLLLPGYNTEDHFNEVRETLERERVPFVVRSFYFWGPRASSKDTLLPYLETHYQPVRIPREKGAFPFLHLMRRRPDADTPLPTTDNPPDPTF